MHKLGENLRVDPAMIAATLNNSSNVASYLWVDMSLYDSLLCIIQSAAMHNSSVVTVQLKQATNNAGANVKSITGFTSSFSGTDDNKAKVISLRAENLDVNNSFRYVAVLLTETATQNAAMSATFVRERARYAQATLPA